MDLNIFVKNIYIILLSPAYKILHFMVVLIIHMAFLQTG